METRDKLLELINNTIGSTGVVYSDKHIFAYKYVEGEADYKRVNELKFDKSKTFLQAYIEEGRFDLYECTRNATRRTWFESDKLSKLDTEYREKVVDIDRLNVHITFKEGEPVLSLRTKVEHTFNFGNKEVHEDCFDVDNSKYQSYISKIFNGKRTKNIREILFVSPAIIKTSYVIEFGTFKAELTEEEAQVIYNKCVSKLEEQNIVELNKRIEDYK